MDKVALEQVFSDYFGFPCQFSFLRLLHTHRLSSGGGTIGQLVADVPSGLSLIPYTYIYVYIHVFLIPLYVSLYWLLKYLPLNEMWYECFEWEYGRLSRTYLGQYSDNLTETVTLLSSILQVNVLTLMIYDGVLHLPWILSVSLRKYRNIIWNEITSSSSGILSESVNINILYLSQSNNKNLFIYYPDIPL
jgi:hypothetical protein